MNTFEQLLGRQIQRILRLDTTGNISPLSVPLAIYLMLDENSGLLVGFGFHNETITLDYMTLEEVQNEYGTEFGETHLNEVESSNRLRRFAGQALKSIKVGKFTEDKLVGENFVVTEGQYAVVVIQTITEKLTIYSTKDGGQVIFDDDEIPVKQQNWTLQ